jgi:hypothetical protein
MGRHLFAWGVLLAVATPGWAAETCPQALADATAQAKAAPLGAKGAARLAELIAEAGELCKGDAAQQARGVETLRVARIMMGE